MFHTLENIIKSPVATEIEQCVNNVTLSNSYVMVADFKQSIFEDN